MKTNKYARFLTHNQHINSDLSVRRSYITSNIQEIECLNIVAISHSRIWLANISTGMKDCVLFQSYKRKLNKDYEEEISA